jgi:hypothetical protein
LKQSGEKVSLDIKSLENGHQKVTIYFPELFEKVSKLCGVEQGIYEILQGLNCILLITLKIFNK